MPRMERTIVKPKHSKQTASRMIKDFKHELPLIIVVILLSIGSAILSVLSPIYLQDILNEETMKSMFTIGTDQTLHIIWALFLQKFGIVLGIYVVSALLGWLSQFLSASISA